MDLDEFPDIHLQRVHAPVFRKDRHLSSALVTTEIQYMLEHKDNPKAIKQEHRELLALLEERSARHLPSEKFLSWAVENWKDFAHTKASLAPLCQAITVAQHALRISIKDYTDKSVKLMPCVPTEELVLLYHTKTNFSKIIEAITFNTNFHQEYKLGKYKCDAFGNLHLVWITQNQCWLITHAHFVCLRDMINSWFDACLYSLINPEKYPTFNFHNEVMKVLRAGRDLVSNFGIKSYQLLKVWPSLTTACILRDREGKTDLFTTLEEELQPFRNTDLYKYLTRTYCSQNQVLMMLEMTGLWKCFGHPDVDMDASVQTWLKKGAAGKGPCKGISNQLLWAFRLEFCRQYYKQRKRWPVVVIGSKAPFKIKRNYQNNLWDENPARPWIPDDFEFVIFSKNLDFDYHIDITDLLSDKSIIPARDQWIHEYDKQAHRTLYGRFPSGPPPTSKSVIVHYLSKESITVKEVIDQLQTGWVPSQWRVMVAVPKEREFKYLDARFYGKMCFEMRLYQTVTEKNIADHIFRYIKNQSMTMSEEQLIRTILRMNTPVLQIEGETYVFIVLDFSSWCTSFRMELVTPLFMELDRLFGLHNVYSFTHYFPLISHLLFQDRFKPPEQDSDGTPKAGPRCYFGPEAWLEGLRQKGWTLATILLILIASWRCGTSASLLGQGDNQVILLRIPPASYLEETQQTRDMYVDNYLKVLGELCTEAGIIIKLAETWYSRHLFEYSRKYHYKGIQASGCLKRITRLASEANQVIPSLTGDLAGIFSTGAASAAEDSTPMHSYFCTIVEACLHLWDACPWMMKEPWEYTCCLLQVTRNLGGYPITIYSQFCTRAVQDVLSTNLHLVRTILNDDILRTQIMRVVTLETGHHKDFLSLIKDPQSLPLNLPVQPENFIKQEIKKGLEDFVVNKDVRNLFALHASTAQDLLVRDLSNIKPCNPRLLSKLYALSNIGLQEKWTGMFANTRSIQQLAFNNWSDELAVIEAVRRLEKNYSNYLQFKKPSSQEPLIKAARCITRYTHSLRESSWGLEMEGITMPPQQEQTKVVPWEQLQGEPAGRAILVTECDHTCLHKPTNRGPHTPYFGSMTKLRAKRAALQVVEVGSIISSIKQLMELHGWVKGNPTLTSLIERLIQEKTDLSVDDLQKYTQKVYSGSLTHRLPCPAMKRGGMSNQNLNHPSFQTIVSDTALQYSKGGRNFTICFQSVFLYGLSVLSHYTELGIPYPKSMGLLFACQDCTTEIEPETFHLESVVYQGLPLVTRITELHHKDVHERYPLHSQMDENVSYAVQMGRKFAAWIVNRRMRDKITSLDNRTLEENITLSFLNLAEFSRLHLPLFLKSFIFYCAVFDTAFFDRSYDYFNEVLEGLSKNPYDVLIDGLRRCGHLRALNRLQPGPPKSTYTISELRTLLHNVLGNLCEDYIGIMTSAYILTMEDSLHTVIRAMQVWLHVHQIPSYITPRMSKEDLDAVIAQRYQGMAIVPVCTLSEEVTTFLIREQPIQDTPNPYGELLPSLGKPEPGTCLERPQYEAIKFFHMIEENPSATALLEISTYPKFQDLTKGLTLVTLEDDEGLCYTVLQHTGLYKAGYPHWSGNRDWEKTPSVITCDVCPISWSKDDYYCNGPKKRITVLPRSLVIIPKKTNIDFNITKGTYVLELCKEGEYLEGTQFRSRSFDDPSDVWILYSERKSIQMTPLYVDEISLLNSQTALSLLRNYLLTHLLNETCLSPFSTISHCLGSLPRRPTDLVLILKTKIRQMMSTWSLDGGRRPSTYEGIIEEKKMIQRRRNKLLKICTYHIIYNLLKKKPWHALSARGVYPYHVHTRTRNILCWQECRDSHPFPIQISDLNIIKYHLHTWIRYIWVLTSVESEEFSILRTPDINFIP